MNVRVMVGVLLAARVAVAQPAAEFAAGSAAYRDGNYAVAAAAFEEAFRIDPRPEVAFSLAQAHRNQYFVDRDVTHLHRALGLYRHYLLEAPTGRRAAHARLHLETVEVILASLPESTPPAQAQPPTQLMITAEVPGATASIDGDAALPVPRVSEVSVGDRRIRVSAPGHDEVPMQALAVAGRLVLVPARLKPRAARVTVQTNGRVEIDGRAISGTANVSPGEHVISVTMRGHRSATRTIDVDPGDVMTVDIALVPTRQRRAARATMIGGGVLAGGAMVAGGLAWAAQRDAVARQPRNATDDAARVDYNHAVARRDAWRGVAIGCSLGAVAAGLTGVALWWFDMPAAIERPAITPLVGPEAVGIAAEGRF